MNAETFVGTTPGRLPVGAVQVLLPIRGDGAGPLPGPNLNADLWLETRDLQRLEPLANTPKHGCIR